MAVRERETEWEVGFGGIGKARAEVSRFGDMMRLSFYDNNDSK